MEDKVGKSILIVGGSASAYSLAKKLSLLDEIGKIFVAPGNDAMKEFSTVIDIREDSIEELLEFSLENAIDITIATGEKAIKSDIATIFQQHGQMIFAPSYASAEICTSKTTGKKFMYKTRILCPKFAIFDKPSMAIDYVKDRSPVVVKTDEHQGRNGTLVCNSFPIAKAYIEDLFESGESKVVVEDYILGHEFSYYVITDGYRALPLGSVANYKYALEGNGGIITEGMGAFSPDYKVTEHIEKRILQQMIYPTLNSLARNQTPYVGILGVDCIVNNQDQVFAIEFNSFLQEPDCQAVLALLDEDLYQMIHACVVGSFADDYEKIDIADCYAASCVLTSTKKMATDQNPIIYGLDDLDDETEVAHFNTKKNLYLEYEATGDRTLVLTRTARTLSRAVESLYDEVSLIQYDGKKYRKDIGK